MAAANGVHPMTGQACQTFDHHSYAGERIAPVRPVLVVVAVANYVDRVVDPMAFLLASFCWDEVVDRVVEYRRVQPCGHTSIASLHSQKERASDSLALRKSVYSIALSMTGLAVSEAYVDLYRVAGELSVADMCSASRVCWLSFVRINTKT